MRQRKSPLEKLDVADPEAKAKVMLVLQVLSGEKTINGACREIGLLPLQYYKLEDKMVRAMVETAMLPKGAPRRDGAEEIRTLSEETEALRQEQRRMQSLVRITRKVLGLKNRRPRKTGPGKPKEALLTQGPPSVPGAEAPAADAVKPPARRPGRPPLHPTPQDPS